MSDFQPGDFVVVNGGLLAEIVTYNEDINLVVYKSIPSGGGYEIHTDHISQTRIELASQPESAPAPAEPEQPELPLPDVNAVPE